MEGVYFDPPIDYLYVSIVILAILTVVVIDLTCCVSGKLQKNEPYYLMKNKEEKQLEAEK